MFLVGVSDIINTEILVDFENGFRADIKFAFFPLI